MADQEEVRAFDDDMARIMGVDDDLNRVLVGEGQRLAAVRERHSRETLARAGAVGQVSREIMRQVMHVQRAEDVDPATFGGLSKAVEEGRMSIDWAYRTVRGDTRRALYVKLPSEVVDKLEGECSREGVTKADLIERILRGRYRI